MPRMTQKRRKELRRVKQFIRRAEKRGYTFSKEFIKSIENKTTRALQLLTPRRLYEQSEYSIGTKKVSGLRGRQIERERASVKGSITKKYGKVARGIEGELLAQALINRQKEKYEATELKNFEAGNLIYQNIIDLIDSYPSSEGAKYLSNLLKSEINTYGVEKVILALGDVNEDLIRTAQEIIYYERNSTQIHASLRDLSYAIRGSMLTQEESRELNGTLEVIGSYGAHS